ncbi:MAG TPA: THUMP domain-containing protein, partial [Nitriliruptorales bacterium]
DRGVRVDATSLDTLDREVTALARPRVAGRTFAIRLNRRGEHDWRSPDAARVIGASLLSDSAGVDLDDPEVEVRVEVYGTDAWVIDRSWPGPTGLPLCTQEPVLALLSGGFDSPVAAWMMMRRGSPVDFVHFTLECAASDHAILVAKDLWKRWGHGSSPIVWKVEFQPVKQQLFERTPPRLRQIVLKQLMFAAADQLADELGIAALVTGDAVGQVSSQTMAHLAQIDRMVTRTVLRPLAGLTKQEIIDWSRRIGTEGLSARAKEVCDLSDGPVAVAAQRETLDRAHESLPRDIVADALADREVIALEHWTPGAPLVPVVAEAPDGVAVVRSERGDPGHGAAAFAGKEAIRLASAAHAAGRPAWVLAPRAHPLEVVPA